MKGDGDDELYCSVILKKGVCIPSDHTRQFQLAQPGQTTAEITILEGKEGHPEHACAVLGRVAIDGLDPVQDKPHVLDVRLRVDKHGMLSAQAFDPLSYVDPISLLQVRFLGQRRRAKDLRSRRRLDRILALTINGIAAGMRHTG